MELLKLHRQVTDESRANAESRTNPRKGNCRDDDGTNMRSFLCQLEQDFREMEVPEKQWGLHLRKYLTGKAMVHSELMQRSGTEMADWQLVRGRLCERFCSLSREIRWSVRGTIAGGETTTSTSFDLPKYPLKEKLFPKRNGGCATSRDYWRKRVVTGPNAINVSKTLRCSGRERGGNESNGNESNGNESNENGSNENESNGKESNGNESNENESNGNESNGNESGQQTQRHVMLLSRNMERGNGNGNEKNE
ncbi:uncharacterized protein EMH_0083540 [Eimeria mitis]|uniref:Uncharacterized protein n=1 Tax=Eimeria mitis TaxID=44415 RepID=U6KDI9_9EIME|nr:uncharacterized protein EMH_0083540 [Eimeria mitis]CDJ33543.1 hypothetical protein EMH_0083540 [Eimeria mitis]